MKKRRNSKWTEDAIFKAIDNFIEKNGRLPTYIDLSSFPDLPTHPSIKNRFDMNVSEFYNTYYNSYVHLCKSRTYHYRTAEYWLNDFKIQYKSLGCPKMETYNLLRNRNTPCACHLLKIFNIGTWNELLALCNFKILGDSKTSVIKREREHNLTCEDIIVDPHKYDEFNSILEDITK